MQARRYLIVAAMLFSLAAGGALAQDKAARQKEVKAKAAATLQEFYKANPKLKEVVAKAPGYAVFTTYGLSFLVGGAGGKGIAHDNKTGRDVYMDLAQASAGVQFGASDTRYLFVFKDAKSLQDFIESGWDASLGGGAGAAVAGKGGGGGGGVFTGGEVYTLTKTGLQVGFAAAGTKVWKDKELN